MTGSESSAPPGLSRRRLIFGGAGVAVAAGLGLAVAGPGRSVLDALPFIGDGEHAPLDRTPMSERLGERFSTRTTDGDRVVLTLSGVDDLPAPSNADNPEGQFVARFHGPRDTVLRQDTYRFSTDNFGDVDVFVVPGEFDSEVGASYTAVFNRMLTEVTP